MVWFGRQVAVCVKKRHKNAYWLIQVFVKALETVEFGVKSPFFKYMLIIYFFDKTKLAKRFF